MRPDEEAGNPRLLEIIRDEIRGGGPMGFERFMELALHHPQLGYYAAGELRLGAGGDFFTASDVGSAFGRCMARQIAEFDRTSGPFEPFSVLEFGAGRGMLAEDVLDALSADAPDLARRVEYLMVDRSARMRAVATERVPRARVVDPESVESGRSGCVIAVELFDALPVQRVRRRDGRLIEIVVNLNASGDLVEQECPAREEVVDWATRHGAAREEGSEAEVALSATTVFDGITAAFERGLMIVVDYGDRAPALYDPRRRRGTLLAYHRHATSEAYLSRVGAQDLTAHVNFTALEQRARETGWDVLGFTTQDRFLVANGILEEFEQKDLQQAHDPARVRRRMQAMQLIHPEAMGRAFRILMLSKNCDPAPRLAGAADPFARR